MAASSSKEQTNPAKGSNGAAVLKQESPWLKSVSSEKAPQIDWQKDAASSLRYDRSDKQTAADRELQTSAGKEFGFDNLESLVKIKFAEAKMFQTRADDARRDAEALKRIAIAKNAKVEEEYEARIAKLQLVETEEMRKQKLEELRAVERAHMEYSHMKGRMEADIKDLLSKMEATKRNFPLPNH